MREARVIDTLTGQVTLTSIEIRDGLIIRFDEPPSRAEGDITLGGRYVLPGLISCHTHLQASYPYEARDPTEDMSATLQRATRQAKATLDAGITTVRCVHELHAVDVVLRNAIRAGRSIGPRILAGGRALTTPGGHGDGLGARTAHGEDGLFDAARTELESGADHVKIFASGGLARTGESLDRPEMTVAEMRGAVRAASAAGTYVVAHAAGSEAIAQALAAGVRSVEHAYRLDDVTATAMATASAFLGATLVVTHSPAWMREAGFGVESINRSMAAGGEHMESIGRALRAGVTLVNSTDFPPGAFHDGVPLAIREMELDVMAGLDPLGAVQSATLNAAELLQLPALGRLSAGGPADMIVVDGNPLEDIAAMRRITTVIQGGNVVRHDPSSSSP